ncbi:MAG: uroporphyrinogen decarboxylase family protein [Spirochaetia bacterium]|jgi:uroporphyrinogen-III decarboxylase
MKNLERFTRALNRDPVDRVLTWDFVDNEQVLVRYGGYDPSRKYTFEQIAEMNARAFHAIGLDMTRYAYDPVNHWMGSKIVNWIRFFGVDPGNWRVDQKGGTAWIAQRPFTTLKELERHMPNPPKLEEVREWFTPFIKYIKEVCDRHDLVWVGGVEGPVTDAYSYMDMELFAQAIYDAPELISRIMDCTGKFSAYIAQVYAEHPSSPLLFMGEDICGSGGPIFSPRFITEQAVPRWHWIMDPVHDGGLKFLFHTDGQYGAALPIILETLGADGLHPVERNGCNDIFELHARYPDKLLFGNVCCEVTLPLGNLFDVEDETLELLERIGPDAGLFVGSSSEIHDLIPPENTETMYRTAHTYGTWPIDVERIRARRREIKEKLKTRNQPQQMRRFA